MKRGRQPEGGRFTPLADIFTSATAAILILLMISSRAPTVVTQREQAQADRVYACLEPSDGAAGGEVVLLLPETDRPRMDFRAVSADLAGARAHDRLSLRVQLLVSARDRTCRLQFESIVQQLNERFDTTVLAAGTGNGGAGDSALYVLLDIALTDGTALARPAPR